MRLWPTLACCCAVEAIAGWAQADERSREEPARRNDPEIAVFYGAATGDYGTGLGARVGGKLGPVFLGGSLTWFKGDRVQTNTGLRNARGALVGAELGLSLPTLGVLELRPYVFGGLEVLRRVDDAGEIGTRTKLGLVPGLLVALHVGPLLVGAEARLMLPPAPTALGGFLVAGVAF